MYGLRLELRYAQDGHPLCVWIAVSTAETAIVRTDFLASTACGQRGYFAIFGEMFNISVAACRGLDILLRLIFGASVSEGKGFPY